MSLALPAFGQTTAVWGETCMFRDEVFALRARSPPMGYKNLACEAQRRRRRSRSLVFLPPPVSDRPTKLQDSRRSTSLHSVLGLAAIGLHLYCTRWQRSAVE